MDKLRRLIRQSPSYEAVDDLSSGDEHEPLQAVGASRFSWIAYLVFLLIGIAMLWAWNMFLAAGPYFQRRFQSNEFILSNFQAAETSVSTLTSLLSMLVLAKLQKNAKYPRRIITSLIMNIIGFILLALSTKFALRVSAGLHFGFFMIMILVCSLATGFMQNGAFAFVSGFGRPEYMQAIMFGQAIAGVLPPLVQMASVISSENGNKSSQESSTSAFVYFLTASGVAVLTLAAFFYLIINQLPRRSNATTSIVPDSVDEGYPTPPDLDTISSGNKSVSMTYLAKRLQYPASAIFLTFAITMVFPVYTQKIVSNSASKSLFLEKAAFIPLAFLVWNSGDLIGRLIPLASRASLSHRPKILLFLSICRLIFIPLYMLCNIEYSDIPSTTSTLDLHMTKNITFTGKRGEITTIAAKRASDIFYLLLVQFPFGLSNGYLGSCCMMGSSSLVGKDEREAAGAFMGLTLIAGLGAGSLCSFFVASSV